MLSKRFQVNRILFWGITMIWIWKLCFTEVWTISYMYFLLSVHSSFIWFTFSNLSFPEANHFKFTTQGQEPLRKAKLVFWLYHYFPFSCYYPVYFSWKWGHPCPMDILFHFVLDKLGTVFLENKMTISLFSLF